MDKKVFIIEDDQDIADALKIILETEGHLVTVITDGSIAYKKIKDSIPKLVILDLLLAGSDGASICVKLKSRSITKNIPIIMISAYPDGNTIAKRSGADDFISKPFSIDELLLKVRSFIK